MIVQLGNILLLCYGVAKETSLKCVYATLFRNNRISTATAYILLIQTLNSDLFNISGSSEDAVPFT